MKNRERWSEEPGTVDVVKQPGDYRFRSFGEACAHACSEAAKGFPMYVIERDEIRGAKEHGAINQMRMHEVRRYGWTPVLDVSRQIVLAAEAVPA